MEHRHLINPPHGSLAAIDSIIGHGRWKDWAELAASIRDDDTLLARIAAMCSTRQMDPEAWHPGYDFWLYWVRDLHNRCASQCAVVMAAQNPNHWPQDADLEPVIGLVARNV